MKIYDLLQNSLNPKEFLNLSQIYPVDTLKSYITTNFNIIPLRFLIKFVMYFFYFKLATVA